MSNDYLFYHNLWQGKQIFAMPLPINSCAKRS